MRTTLRKDSASPTTESPATKRLRKDSAIKMEKPTDSKSKVDELVPKTQELEITPTDPPHVPSHETLPHPIVIPQTSKTWKGAFASPFCRAYVPGLEAHGINQDAFMAFLDGLNEVFIAHPVFQYAQMAGGIMQFFYGLDPVQWAGVGLQFTAGAVSAATSYLRTRAYVKAMNQELFHPAGLHLNVLTTKKMVKRVGYPEEKLSLPERNQQAELDKYLHMRPKDAARQIERENKDNDENDPRMRRLKAMEGHVMPLDFDVPAVSKPDGLYAKMASSHAAKMDRKQTRRINKKRRKGDKKYLKNMRGVERSQRKAEDKLEELEHELEMQEALIERSASSANADRKTIREAEKEIGKIQEEMGKVETKRDKKIEKRLEKAGEEHEKVDKKETKTANKIRWLVIAKWEPESDNEDDDEDSLSDSGSSMEDEDSPPAYSEK